MSKSWPAVRLGEVLTKSDDWVELDPTQIYREVTVRLWGKGVVLRREATGTEIGAMRRLRVRHGQFILSRIDARNGAFGLVPDSLDGAVVSNDFPVFTPNSDRILPEFLGWMSKTSDFVELCKAASEGTTNRVRLKEYSFLAMPVLLPPLPEQRRIVARIEALASKVEAARALRGLVAQEVDSILLSRADQIFSVLCCHFPIKELNSFRPQVTSGPRNWAKHYDDNGYRFYRAQDVGLKGQVVNDSKVFISPPPGEQGRSAMLRDGDLLLVITGATVGRVAVFHDDLEPGFVSQHVAICRLPSDHIHPLFALWGLRSPQGQSQLLGQRYGQGKPGLNLSNIKRLCLPLPPLVEQRRVVKDLQHFEFKMHRLQFLQSETAAELDALLPSALEKALKGEL